MTATMERRGPDDEGLWSSADGQVHLGFRRLSILDLTPAGHQPMLSADGRGVLVFNGEVYNHGLLRADLEGRGVRFRSRSDTEVLVELLRRDGVAGLDRLNGMFGLAYFDVDRQVTLLARDHVGLKPLYYMVEPGGPGFAFASRYDALFHTGWVDVDDIPTDMLDVFLNFGHVPAPMALHRHCGQIPPGGWMEIDRSGTRRSGRWWTPPHEAEHDISDMETAVAATTEAIERAVIRQRVADVAVGAFVSGGIDSPIVAGIAAGSIPAFRAYTISVPGSDDDEGVASAAIGTALGMDHSIIEVGPSDLTGVLDTLPAAMHEPLGSDSIIPTLIVSRTASREVTVALTGDGGDEFFYGYAHQYSALRWARWWRAPLPARRLKLSFDHRFRAPAPSAAGAIGHRDVGQYYRAMFGTGSPAASSLVAGPVSGSAVDRWFEPSGPPTPRNIVRYCAEVELGFRLAQILNKVDMGSMHYGVEARAPLLDREVIDVASRIAPSVHLAGWLQKAVLRRILHDRIAPVSAPTKKTGFVMPVGSWLKQHARDRVGAALCDPWSLPVDEARAEAVWHEHLSGSADHSAVVWRLLVLRWWRDRVADEVRSSTSSR